MLDRCSQMADNYPDPTLPSLTLITNSKGLQLQVNIPQFCLAMYHKLQIHQQVQIKSCLVIPKDFCLFVCFLKPTELQLFLKPLLQLYHPNDKLFCINLFINHLVRSSLIPYPTHTSPDSEHQPLTHYFLFPN